MACLIKTSFFKSMSAINCIGRVIGGQMKLNFKKLSLITIYTIWAILTVFTNIFFAFTEQFREKVSNAVLKADSPLPNGISHETVISFLVYFTTIVGVIYFLIIVSIGYLFVVFASKGRKWAQWLFLLFCLWDIIGWFWSSYRFSQMYSDLSFVLFNIIESTLPLIVAIILSIKTITLIKEEEILTNQVNPPTLSLSGRKTKKLESGYKSTLQFTPSKNGPLDILIFHVSIDDDSDVRIVDFWPSGGAFIAGPDSKNIASDGKKARLSYSLMSGSSPKFDLTLSGRARIKIEGNYLENEIIVSLE